MSERSLKITCDEGFTSITIEESNGILGITVNDKETAYLNREELLYLLDEINHIKKLIQ